MKRTVSIKTSREKGRIHPAIGALVAIATAIALSISGLSATLNVLMLIPLMGLFWYLERLSRAEMGFVWGRLRHYGLALLYPLFGLGLVGLVAWITGATNLQNTDWSKAALDSAVLVLATILVSLVTEEGFFRGWLWSSFNRAGMNKNWVIVWTSLAFAAWHMPVAFIDTGFSVPLPQVPVYIFNVFVAGGVIFGLIRLISGSVIVTSVSHGLWNGIGYTLLGAGGTVGALGIQDTAIYGPEIGALGVVVNVAFATMLWLWYRRAGKMADTNQALHAAPGLTKLT
jgi:hypothetical protein